MTIGAVLEARTGDIISVRGDTPMGDVVALLAAKRIGAVPVVDDGAGGVVGILSERDVLYGLAREGAALLDRTAAEVMTSPTITVEPEMHLLDALGLMTRRRIRHLPVIVDDRMIGFVSISDLVKARIEAIEGEAEAMRAYIQAT